MVVQHWIMSQHDWLTSALLRREIYLYSAVPDSSSMTGFRQKLLPDNAELRSVLTWHQQNLKVSGFAR